MATAQQIPVKYCKTLLASGSTSMTPTQAARFFDKLLYEFWGFCVNGTNSLTVPGGFAPVSGVNYPTGFQSGSSVLLAQGRDGSTTFGTDVFGSQSTNFLSVNSGSLIGRYLVTWVPGQSSTDDSVYLIKSVEDANHLRVDIHTGGTRRVGNHPVFWDRNNISFRVVDILATTNLTGWGEGHSMVLSFVAAPTVNAGQAVPQVRFFHHTQSNGSEGNVGLVVSPSGSWSASGTFSDAATEVTGTWFNAPAGGGASNGLCTYTLIGAGDFLIAEARGPAVQGVSYSNGAGFHIEVPQRLYSKQVDPNPIAWAMWTNAAPSQVAATYYNGLNMVGIDGVARPWTTLVRSPMGTQVQPLYTGSPYGTGQWQQFTIPDLKFGLINFDQYDQRYVTTDGLMSLQLPGQFSMRRARLRRVRFTANNLQRGARIGDPVTEPAGWTCVSNGVLWPWDNSILPLGPWWSGV